MIQIETAMGAAIEVFEDSRTIEVGRDRFVPVKTTNDLLVLRSDAYDLGNDFVLDQVAESCPFVDLDERTTRWSRTSTSGSRPASPSLKDAESLSSPATGPSARASGCRARPSSRANTAGSRQARSSERDGARNRVGACLADPDQRPLPSRTTSIGCSTRIEPMQPFEHPLMDAIGLPVAEDVHAPVSLPVFDNSGMDGYAVAFSDVADATAERPVHLPVVGEIAAGQTPSSR